MSELNGQQLDIAGAVLRIEQIGSLPDGALRDHLIGRLVTCDAPRLRQYLTAETIAEMEEIMADVVIVEVP